MPPVSSKAKDYTDRPEEVVDELDDLRTRGIAKVLNKHFTTTTKQLAIEKAEADSALADLERRRAQTKAFVPSKGGDLNPYDQMYVQLQQKRTECRRKEKETMMLYQRYVMKYGKSAKATPLISSPTSSSPSKDLHPQEGAGMKDDSLRTSNSGDPPGSSSALGTLDENSEITFSKFYEKQEQRAKKDTKQFMSELNKFMTVSEDEEDQQQQEQANVETSNDAGDDVPELVASKDSQQEPVSSSSKVDDPFMSAISKFSTTTPTKVTTTPAQRQDDEGKTESSMVEDDDIQSDSAHAAAANLVEPDTDDSNNHVAAAVDADPASIEEPEKNRTSSNDPPGIDLSGIVVEDESMVSQQQQDHKKDPSPRKSQTATQEKGETAPSTPDLIMPGAAPITLSPSSHRSSPKTSKGVQIEVGCFDTTTVEGYDIDDRSIISELTSANSVAISRQLMDEVETEMDDFIKFEMEAIRKMLDSESEGVSAIDHSISGVHSENSSLMAGDKSVHDAMQAEAMALEMQKILDDFAKEDASSVAEASTQSKLDESAQSSEHKNGETATPTSVYPYKFEPAIPGEEWYVHFDDTYQKEFYVEKLSNRTQWDYPKKVPTPRLEQQIVSSDEFLSDINSVASSRRSLSRRSSRRSLYRKQRKKRRARRLMMSFLALLCVLVVVFYWRIHQPEEPVAGALVAVVVNLRNSVIDQYEYSFTDRTAREEKELRLLQQQANAKAEQEKTALELAAQKKAKEEARRIAAKEAKVKAAREEASREAARKLAREQEAARKLTREQEAARQQQLVREQAERERLAKIEAEEKKGTETEPKKVRRNGGCNIPFAYVVPHCWRLAKTKPIFGLKSETDFAFLQ